MTRCDVCGRACFRRDATTFPKNDVVICRRASCQSVATHASLRYYETGIDGVESIIQEADV